MKVRSQETLWAKIKDLGVYLRRERVTLYDLHLGDSLKLCEETWRGQEIWQKQEDDSVRNDEGVDQSEQWTEWDIRWGNYMARRMCNEKWWCV